MVSYSGILILIYSERRQDMLKLQQIVKDYQASPTTVHEMRGEGFH